jgi:hypothetical protein
MAAKGRRRGRGSDEGELTDDARRDQATKQMARGEYLSREEVKGDTDDHNHTHDLARRL